MTDGERWLFAAETLQRVVVEQKHLTTTDGEYMGSYSSALRYCAAVDLRMRRDVSAFRAKVTEAVEINIVKLESYDAGGKVAASYVTMRNFHWGLDAFAAGNEELGRRLFAVIGGRLREERKNDHKFILALGYSIKDLVVTGTCTSDSLALLDKHVSSPSWVGFRDLITGLSKRDLALAEAAVVTVLKKQKMLTRPGSTFNLTPDEVICYWALGLVNYGRMIGMPISVPESDYIPAIALFRP